MSEIVPETNESDPQSAAKSGKIKIIGAAAVALLLAFVATYFLYFRVTVPHLVELKESDAISRLESSGLTVGLIDRQFSDEVPAGEVINQIPFNLSEVNRGDTIGLIVSKGPELRDIVFRIDSTGTALFGVSGDCQTGLTMTNSVHNNADLVLTDSAGAVHSAKIHVVSSLENACTFAATIPQIAISKAPFQLSLGGDIVHPATNDVFSAEARKPVLLTAKNLRASGWKVGMKCYIVCFAKAE